MSSQFIPKYKVIYFCKAVCSISAYLYIHVLIHIQGLEASRNLMIRVCIHSAAKLRSPPPRLKESYRVVKQHSVAGMLHIGDFLIS